ncbi:MULTISPECIES: hypothetical protein [unclassified Leifsonia]|uniref:hypothetical protein n=1 Tax=unclassified Leifsonia TaxID=2663824 RepID=UPI0008A7CAEA|nr:MULTISPECIES: hypothetical protein [unclassified Leifsonia]SEI17758.1 hypothetical protein SAMN04515694_1325 [Leifsonia sp. CL154]SFM11273.1 hypothetical protein SAMN04515692_1315 [Leifsonia sp. CL147]
MNHEQYVQKMSEIGYSREDAEDLIWLSKDSSDLVLRTFNFVPTAEGLYEIWISGDRDDFFRVSGPNGEEFLGTLSDAYEYVFERKRKWREKQARAQQQPE